MRTIRVTDEVWKAIASRGQFGETENDVLERVFDIHKPVEEQLSQTGVNRLKTTFQKRHHFATSKMSAEVRGKVLYVSFDHGASDSWALPEKSDKSSIRIARDKAVEFSRQNKASFGQEQAVKKALTDAGYWLSK